MVQQQQRGVESPAQLCPVYLSEATVMRSLFLGDTSPVCLGGGLVEGPHPMVPTWLCSHKSSLPHLESEGCQRFHWWEGKPRQASDNPGLSGGWARRWGEAGILAWLHLES